MVIARNAQALFVISLLVILAIGYLYFFQVSIVANVAYEPVIEDNTLEISKIITFLNALELYKLNEIPISNEKPVIELVIPENKKVYSITIEDHDYVISYSTVKPDIRLNVSEELLNTLDSNEKITDDALSAMNIEILSDEKTLALKGYKNLYNKISGQGVTGKVVEALNPTEFDNILYLTAVIFLCIILGLLIEKEF